ncbi:HalOD1 output domain-containing protein [Halorussus amylolyticus]|uniref:HalOD1 output domain-containing protein n=1 Tax=Halorussus amylolyticus TaxID=1126242 RepID=UPI00104F54C6|nr:HalOD1 output domain-containing protein [Halorussus amylolyticus]
MNRNTTHRVERAPSLDRDGRAAYRIRTNGTDLSIAVVEGVAEIADCDPTSEGEVLYDVVDPDALERLFDDRHDGTARVSGRVSFDLRECSVEVYAEGEPVVFAPADSPTRSEPGSADITWWVSLGQYRLTATSRRFDGSERGYEKIINR